MFKFKNKLQKNRGMTYVELIVVMGIFVTMLSVALFNYKRFQAAVDIKNLSNDIALKVVEAEKSSVSGKVGVLTFTGSSKPSYGVYFNAATPTQFLYFADLNNSGGCDTAGCNPTYAISGEVQDVINITKGNTISSIGVNGTSCPATVSNLTVVFKRPSSTPSISSTTSLAGCTISYFSVNLSSPQGSTSVIKLYPSGRIQIN